MFRRNVLKYLRRETKTVKAADPESCGELNPIDFASLLK